MKDFVIMTDSSCDLPAGIVEQYGIKVVPLTITVNDNTYKHYYDYCEFSQDDYFKALCDGVSGTTAGTNVDDAVKMMNKIVNAGSDILYLSLSSGLSCSYQNAVLASEMVSEDYPDAIIHVIDTKSVCVGLGLLNVVAAQAKESGKTLDEVVEIINDKIANIKHYFTVNDLAALSRSGRISHLTAIAGSVLNIKPMLHIGEDGRIQSSGKVRGRKMAVKQLIDSAVKNVSDHSIFFVAHANAYGDAETVKNALIEMYPDSEVIIGVVGPIIGIHVGNETLAVICA